MTLGHIIFFVLLAFWSGGLAYLFLFTLLPIIQKKAVQVSHDAHAGGHGGGHGGHAPAKLKLVREVPRHSSFEGFKSYAKKGKLTVDDLVNSLINE